jgi:sugar-specific transcriptional regulator TrmB
LYIFGLLKDFIKYRTFDLHKIIEARSQEVRDLKAELEAKVGKLEDEDESDDEIIPIRPNQS